MSLNIPGFLEILKNAKFFNPKTWHNQTQNDFDEQTNDYCGRFLLTLTMENGPKCCLKL